MRGTRIERGFDDIPGAYSGTNNTYLVLIDIDAKLSVCKGKKFQPQETRNLVIPRASRASVRGYHDAVATRRLQEGALACAPKVA